MQHIVSPYFRLSRRILRSMIPTVVCFIAATTITLAQEGVPLRIVSTPTAGVLPARSYALETHLTDNGGVAERLMVGATDLLTLGVSWSGSGIVGSERITWQPHVGIQARVRIIEESERTPAVAVGFDSQGEGVWIGGDNLNRFRTKSRGAYLVISRNYALLGDLGFHGGANYSLEDDDGDRDPSFWVGLDKSITSLATFTAEYDFATNDNDNDHMTANRGFLNGAVKLHLVGGFTVEAIVRNILRNEKRDLSGHVDYRPEPSRELRLVYTAGF